MLTDLQELNGQARVWIYPSDSVFSEQNKDEINIHLNRFITSWTAHNQALKSYGNVFHNQFVTLFVDETMTSASGCSIDSSVRFVQELGKHYQVDFFNRMLFSYIDADSKVISLKAPAFKQAFADGKITEDTMVFDHLVKTKEDFEKSWMKPLKDSWHKRFV